MADKVLLLVRLPTTRCTYEVRVCVDLTVGEAATMIASLVAAREERRYLPGDDVGLMVLEGEHAGRLLEGTASLRDFVCEGMVCDGTLLALV